MPLIVRWKNRPAGRVDEKTVVAAVVLPHLHQTAKIKTPKVAFDGMDMSATFT